MLAIRDISQADIDFMPIDTLQKQNFEAPFIDFNPNATVPMLSQGTTKVIGDGDAIFNYLVNTSDEVRAKFFHEA